MSHFKSWSGLRKQLESLLCEELKGRINYFLTYYHRVHDSYGRAAVRLDRKDIVCFSWINRYRQEWDVSRQYEERRVWDCDDPELAEKWRREGNYCEMNFLDAALEFLNLPISEALNSENYLIRLFAILDRRVGKRTLNEIADSKEYLGYPDWVRQFYELRIENREAQKEHWAIPHQVNLRSAKRYFESANLETEER